jgi:hypothetical protein
MPSNKKDRDSEEVTQLIGDIKFTKNAFARTKQLLTEFLSESFLVKSSIERNVIVNQTLLSLISEQPKGCYVLPEMVDFMEQVSDKKILDGNYNQTAFERWLNQHSGLTYEENREIRGKIVGKYIPRDEFQRYFPIGHNKVYKNSHVVTAHNPPDLDSTTASFIGWMDAFACRVGGAMTIWNLPQGMPGPLISKLFTDVFSDAIFSRLAKDKVMISPVAMDLVRQNRLIRVSSESNIRDFHHKRHENHIILVDTDGFYVGDWRVSDVDSVGRIQRLLNICLNILEKQVVQGLTSIMAKKRVEKGEIKDFINSLFREKIPEHGMLLHRFSSNDYEQLDAYLKKVLHVKEGCHATMEALFKVMDERTDTDFADFMVKMERFLQEDLFDPDECLDYEFHHIFNIFNEAYISLNDCTKKARQYFDRIDVAMAIKKDVLGYQPSYITTKAEINEIMDKIKDYGHISVCFPDKNDQLVPVGVIHREDMESPVQGTVSLRDFCNHDEIKIAKSIQVISAIDHHKSTMSSNTCMTLTVADVQSANVLVAEKAFEINDAYGMHGQSMESAKEQTLELLNGEQTAQSMRCQEKLIKKKQAHHRAGSSFFISPEREVQEYLFFLNAIIDDTDLLSKSGWRDLYCVCELINRIKSIQAKKEIEVIDITHYPRQPRYLKQAIRDTLTCEDSYSFYEGIYKHREVIINKNIIEPKFQYRCFEDRKIQNETCAVSQTKIFPGNRAAMKEHRFELLKAWFKIKAMISSKASEVDFFLHMNSTIPGGEEAYKGKMPDNGEEDEIWLNVNYDSDHSTSRFRQFLDYLKISPKYTQIRLHLSIEGPLGHGMDHITSILRVSVPHMKIDIVEQNDIPEPIVVFKFKQGTLNSRKSDITPFLPTQ